MAEIQEWRKMLKKHHLCRECKQQDAYTLAGRSLCAECAEKERERASAYRAIPENRKKMHAAAKAKKAMRRMNAKCSTCGRPLENGKYKTCAYCRAKQRKFNVRRLRRAGVQSRTEGICWQCNKEPVMDGHKLCASCYAKKVPIALENLEKVRENNLWKKGW